MGTQLQQRDEKIPKEAWEGNEGCNELLNATCPEVLSEIYRAYLVSGADLITTNAFGSFSWVLDEYGIGHRAYELTYAGTKLAKDECEKVSTPEHPRYWICHTHSARLRRPVARVIENGSALQRI